MDSATGDVDDTGFGSGAGGAAGFEAAGGAGGAGFEAGGAGAVGGKVVGPAGALDDVDGAGGGGREGGGGGGGEVDLIGDVGCDSLPNAFAAVSAASVAGLALIRLDRDLTEARRLFVAAGALLSPASAVGSPSFIASAAAATSFLDCASTSKNAFNSILQ